MSTQPEPVPAEPSPFDRVTARAICGWSLLGAVPGIVMVATWRGDFALARAYGGIAMYLGSALALLLYGRAKGVDLARLFGRPLRAADVPRSIGLALTLLSFSLGTMLVVIAGVTSMFPGLLAHFTENSPDFIATPRAGVDPVATAGLIASAVLLAPPCEEMLFRGFLLSRWTRRHGARGGVILSAALFGALHFALAPFGAFALGIVAGVLALRTRSLWPGILTHATINATVVTATTVGQRWAGQGPELPDAAGLRNLLLLGLGLVAVSAPILVVAVRRMWRARPAEPPGAAPVPVAAGA